MADTNELEMSHKGQKIHSYPVKMKIEAVNYAEVHGNRPAGRKYGVDEKRIREWRKNKAKISSLVSLKGSKMRKRLDGGGAKPLSTNLEERIMDWITIRRASGLRVSRKLIMKKAQLLHQEMSTTEGVLENEEFKASRGWLEKFMRRNNLSLRRKTSVAQKDPEKLIAKLVSYVIQTRRMQKAHNFQASQIIAMDETPVWSDMVSQTTVDGCGKKTITMKSTGHEKSRVSVCLAAKADGTKLKPMIVFKGAVRETKVLSEEFKSKAVIASSPNAWMNTELTHVWVDKVLGTFSFQRRLLAWDSYECHIEDTVKKSLTAKKIDVVIVPGGCTKYIQAPDVSWNKTFKAECTERYDDWLAEEGINNETVEGNLKAPPRRAVVKWILDAWSALPSNMIKDSFMHCGLNLPADGSLDHQIHCFKDKQPCAQGRELLRTQLSILDEPQNDPFQASESDIEDAYEPDQLLDPDEEGDEDEDVDIC